MPAWRRTWRSRAASEPEPRPSSLRKMPRPLGLRATAVQSALPRRRPLLLQVRLRLLLLLLRERLQVRAAGALLGQQPPLKASAPRRLTLGSLHRRGPMRLLLHLRRRRRNRHARKPPRSRGDLDVDLGVAVLPRLQQRPWGNVHASRMRQ